MALPFNLQDYFAANFGGESVAVLLGTLRRLDAQRVAAALQQVNAMQTGALAAARWLLALLRLTRAAPAAIDSRPRDAGPCCHAEYPAMLDRALSIPYLPTDAILISSPAPTAHLACPGTGAELAAEAITTIFECLTYCQLLEDAEVAGQLARALLTLSSTYDLALGEGGARYPGVYRLLAHPQADVRNLVRGL